MKLLVRFFAGVAALAVAAVIWLWLNSITLDSAAAHGQRDVSAAKATFAEAIEISREVVKSLVSLNATPAISVAVAIDGELAWSEASGWRDIEARLPVSTETRFPIGSTAKPLSATAALSLVADGSLNLDAPIAEYVPYWPTEHATISLRQLLSHQAGIRHYRLRWNPTAPWLPSESAMNIEFPGTETAVALFAQDQLQFEPDTSFGYSTYGYTLASAAMESAARQTFATLMQERVFEPANMWHTELDRASSPLPDRATEYIVLGNGFELMRAPPTNNSYKWAGGGMLSTPEDLVLFGDALMSGRLIDDSLRTLMLTPRKLASGEGNPQNYGLGWRIARLGFPAGSATTATVAMHGGTGVGSQATLIIVPDLNIAVAMTTNASIGDSGPLTQAAVDIARAFHANRQQVEQ
ncbi:MAG: serine hydrolase domain-containing protein [Pseudomonadota bacterium]